MAAEGVGSGPDAFARMIKSLLDTEGLAAMADSGGADEVAIIRERFEGALTTLRDNIQRLVDRGNLIGRPLDFPLTPAAGPPTRLAALAGSTPGVRTLVVFWDAVRSPAGPPGLHPFVQKAPPNTQWVYVALGAWRPPTKASPVASPGNANASAAAANAAALAGPPAIRASAAPPGTYCVEPLGLRSTVAAQLKLSSLPFVCVLDDRKRLNAFGRIDEIPALLAGINRLLEQ